MASASLIPHDPTVMFTVAGMVPFKPYFVGDEVPPFQRAVSSQKCARAGGKHNDLDDVGRTKRHLVFFEMLGNFSFGDYFKNEIIPWSWELFTGDPSSGGWGFDGDRLWITVHETDDEAEAIWHEQVGVPLDRIQRLGDKDNFWQMGDTGPCGPCSEIHIDRGPGIRARGRAARTIPTAIASWSSGTSSSCSTTRRRRFADAAAEAVGRHRRGARADPRPDARRRLGLGDRPDGAADRDRAVGHRQSYRVGDYDDRDSFAMRMLAEHARSSTMLVTDGVFPSNEGRGYVLRRIIRRAVRHAYLLGTEELVMPRLVETAIDVMGNAYPDVVKNRDFVLGVLIREEERFRQTMQDRSRHPRRRSLSSRRGAVGFDRVPAARHVRLPARAHAGDRRRAFASTSTWPDSSAEMAAQRAAPRRHARATRPTTAGSRRTARSSSSSARPSSSGYISTTRPTAAVLAVLPGDADGDASRSSSTARRSTPSPAARSATPARSAPTPGRAEVLDTTFALPGLRRHIAASSTARSSPARRPTASIDVERRERDPSQPHRHPPAALGVARACSAPT